MAAFFIRRPIVAMVISLVLMIAGVVVIRRLPVAKFPEITPPQVLVNATYVGADAITVEQSVATPIEQQVNGVEQMIYMQSVNANDGTMTLRVSFEVGVEPNTAQVLVQNRVAQATPRLPLAVANFGVTTRKAYASPLMVIALYSPGGSYDNRFLANYATINLTDELLRLNGVGDVRVFGAADYAMRIWVDPDRLANLGLTVADLSRAVQRQSTVNPAGQLGGQPAPKGQVFTYTIRTKGRLATPEEFAGIIVRANPDGSLVRLGDLARVELGTETYGQAGRYGGKNSAVLGVYQLPGSNALDVAKDLKAAMTAARAKFPADMEDAVAVDSTAPIEEGIREILVTLLEALGLVIVVVYVFLQSWRATLIPLLTVPVSLLGTFVLFPLFGFSINTLSLFGLVLAIGLVVDDAIVVVEAVQHHIEDGLDPTEAALAAMREVSAPVVAIALALSSVFIPVAFVGGVQGRLYQQFAVTIALSVLISAFNALSLSPALSALLLRRSGQRRGPMRVFFDRFNRGFEWTRGRYLRATLALVRKAGLALIALAAFGALGVLTSRTLPTSFVPQEDQGFMYGNLQLPDAASLQRTDAAMRQVEAILAQTPGVAGYAAVSGFSILNQTAATNQGLMFIPLRPWTERRSADLSAQAISMRLNRALATITDGRAITFLPPAILGIGTSGGFEAFVEDRSGGSVEALAAATEKFVAAAQQRPELTALVSSFRPTVPQLFAQVDESRALSQGVDLGDLYTTLSAFMGGAYVNDFNRFGRQWRVYVQAEGKFRTRPEDISHFYVRNAAGAMASLSTLVAVNPTNGPQFTNRFNLYRAAQITGTAAPGYSSGQAMNALEQVARQTLPQGMALDWSGLSFQERRAGGIGGVLALSILLVFLILAALYESWTLPFSVLLSTPVALFGALLGLFVRKLQFDVYGQIGLIMLIGLAAKNAILIVEFARDELEKRRATIEEAALAGARLRLRPILMTSFAFILGMLPLWWAKGAGATARQELGSAVIVGLLVATVFGVLLVPALFALVERLTARVRRRAPVPAPQRGAPEPA